MKTIFRIAQTRTSFVFLFTDSLADPDHFAFQAGMAFCDTFSYQLQNKALDGADSFQTVILLLGIAVRSSRC